MRSPSLPNGRLKVLAVTAEPHPYIVRQIAALSKHTHVRYVSLNNRDLLPLIGRRMGPVIVFSFLAFARLIRNRVVPLGPRFLVQLLLQSSYLMLLDRDEHFDIFHAYWLYPSAIACLIARRKQTKIVAAVCGYDLQGDRETRYGALLHPLKSLLSQKALCTADVIVTSFEIHSQTALRMVGTEMPGRIVFIPSCVDVKAIRAAVITRGKTREPLILFAPRVSELYGAVEFVEAALRLLRDHAETSFVLAGDGSLRNKLAKRVRSLGRDGRIRFTGRVSHTDFLGLISEASIVCDLASPGQGATTLEAQALGRVVVGVSGPKRLIIDGKTGILVPRGNTNELFLALKRLLSDKDEADRMAHQAYTSVVKNHDISLVVGKTLQIYDSLVQRLSR